MTDARQFEPVNMPVGVLTAALQELTPRERRDPDPDLAVEEWLQFASELNVDCIELFAPDYPRKRPGILAWTSAPTPTGPKLT